MHKYKTDEQRNAVEQTYKEYFDAVGNHEAAAILTLVQYLDELVGTLTFQVHTKAGEKTK